jgi:hypothetical protein
LPSAWNASPGAGILSPRSFAKVRMSHCAALWVGSRGREEDKQGLLYPLFPEVEKRGGSWFRTSSWPACFLPPTPSQSRTPVVLFQEEFCQCKYCLPFCSPWLSGWLRQRRSSAQLPCRGEGPAHGRGSLQ